MSWVTDTVWSSLPKVPTEVCIGPSLKGEKASPGVILENEVGARVRVSWKVCVFVCVCVCVCVCVFHVWLLYVQMYT